VRGINRHNSKVLIKSLFQKWKADIYCLQETKVHTGVEDLAKQLWSCRWMKCGYMEAEGSKGGILIMWDSRNWRGTQVEMGQHSITYEFVSTQNSFTWYLTGVYAPDSREEKLSCWEEISAVKELCGGPWVACGDFNTIRSMGKEECAIESLM